MCSPSPRSGRLAALAAGALLLELLCRARADQATEVLRADFGVSAGIIAVVSILSGLFSRFRGSSTDLGAKLAIEGVRTDVTSLGKTLTSLIVGVAGQISSVLGVVRRFLAKVFGKLYDMLHAVVTRISRILDKIFGPIIDFLDRIKGHLKKFYENVIRPILDIIELVRGFTRLLAAAGVDWAKELDAKLLALEQRILEPYTFIIGKINEVSNWINRIVTLDGFLQRVMLLQSLVRDVAYTNNLWWNSQLGTLPSRPGPPGGGTPPVDPVDVTTEMRNHFRTGNADVSPAIRESIANVNINIRKAA